MATARKGPGASDDLFAAAVEERLTKRAPLAARIRPRSLDEVVGQSHLLASGKPLRVLIESDRLSSLVLWGPPGTGKTTIARLVAGASSKVFEPLSAVSAGVKDVRDVVDRARERLGQHGRGTILFLDEVHRFNRTQQDALLPHVEEGVVVLIGATTENPYFSLTGPLLSRSTLFRLEPIEPADLEALMRRALADVERGLGAEPLDIADDALAHLADRAEGDARHALTCLELAHALAAERASGGGYPAEQRARPDPGGRLGGYRPGAEGAESGVVEAEEQTIELADAEAALAMRSIHYGDDEHYDIISAFIKSIRGSDPDAGLYWLARMLEAGEDPRFVARRLVILASEDIGLADHRSLLVAEAAARAVEFVGMPEARLNLAQAVLHLALAPKSNSVIAAIGAATEYVRERPAGRVPTHLRDAHYPGARTLGHGEGYVYPHDAPDGWVAQDYLPPEVAADIARRPFYRPGPRDRNRGPGEGDERGER